MDSLRDGGFGLANTNKLLKTYDGITGMKTGYTEAAGHCLAATAVRGDLSLISVILGGETSKGRFASAASLLDYGFANYSLLRRSVGDLSPIPVTKGKKDSVSIAATGELCTVVPKGKLSGVTVDLQIESVLSAPVSVGQQVGKAVFSYEGQEILSVPVIAMESVDRAGFFDYFSALLDRLFS